MKKIFASSVFILLLVFVFWPGVLSMFNQSKGNRVLDVELIDAPFSSDPIDYDSLTHHVTFRSVFSSLVSQYKTGEFVGIIAESWKSTDDLKTWTFKLRKNFFFSNGKRVTAEEIARSFSRTAYLMKKRGSRNNFLDHIVGYENIRNASDIPHGIEIGIDSLTLKFVKPIPKFLETVSFGLYSIAYHEDFDQIDGTWLKNKNPVSSGPYVVESWSENNLTLSSNPYFPKIDGLGHAKRFDKVRFLFGEKTNLPNIGMMLGTSLDKSPGNGFSFYGGPVSYTAFVRLYNWKKNLYLSIRANRRTLRDLIYESFKQNGFKVTRSFFPTTLKGVSEFPSENESSTQKVSDLKFNVGPFFYFSNLVLKDLFEKVLLDLSEKSHSQFKIRSMTTKERIAQLSPDLSEYLADFGAGMTGILIEDPDRDIRFMFESKEGVRLPDEDGSIHPGLKKDKLDLQVINEKLWEQAIIWPLSHFSIGLWAKDNVDLSLLNLSLPPTDFLWIGEK